MGATPAAGMAAEAKQAGAAMEAAKEAGTGWVVSVDACGYSSPLRFVVEGDVRLARGFAL